jgi:ComF family protein
MSLSLRAPIDGLLAVLVAPRCVACGTVLDSPSRGPVCAACWLSISPISPPICDRCGDALPSWRRVSRERGICPACRRRPALIARARSAGAYDGALRRVIHALKYEGRRSLAAPLARLMGLRGAEILVGADLLVPVPLNWRRGYARGFNQAEELARHLGLPVCAALRRGRATRPQFGLPAVQRRRNVRGAFGLRRRRRAWVTGPRPVTQVQGRVVVLVDDVSTTGATLDACAAVLLAAGAREVRALTAARAPCRRR